LPIKKVSCHAGKMNVFRMLIVSQTQEDRLAEFSIRRPFLECDLSDQPRGKVRHVFVPRRINQRGVAASQGPESLEELSQRIPGKPCPDLADVAKLPVIVGSQQKRAEVLA
jgi:hypothetical protein